MKKRYGQDIHDRIRMVRELLGLSQEKFAHKLGISLSFYAKIENGFALPGVRTLEKFYKNGISVDFLISGEPPIFLDKHYRECMKECYERKFFGLEKPSDKQKITE
jgi:transcriptional regulator with XRE-family HTH domain